MSLRTNKYIIGALFCGALMGMASCSDDFLQKDSLTSVSKTTFWKTSDDAKEGLAHVMTLCRMDFSTTMLPTKTSGMVVAL